MNSGIYIIYNKINGKYYIGSAVNFTRRKAKHFNQLKQNIHTNKYLQNAYNKYWGSINFEFLIVEYCTPDKLESREQWWLNITHCWKRHIGYNILQTTDTRLGVLHTEESKAKMSMSNKGRVKSPEWQANINAALKGKKRTEEQRKQMSLARIGKSIPEERRLRISESHKGKKHSQESKIKRSAKLKGRKVGGYKQGTYNHSEETKRKISEAAKKRSSQKQIILLKPPVIWTH